MQRTRADRATGGGDRLDEWAILAAQAAVDHVRSELATVASRLPDPQAMRWHSPAQRRFGAALEGVSHNVHQAMAALEHAHDELSRAQASPSTGQGSR